LAFEQELKEIQKSFHSYWEFQREFQKISYLTEFKKDFISLAKLLNRTITNNPVKYIGSSMNLGHHALFQLEKINNSSKKTIFGYFDLLQSSPQIKISKTYFEGLIMYGGLLSGTNSILMNWVHFMNKQQPNHPKRNEDLVDDLKSPYLRRSPLNLLLQSETINRQTETIRKFWTFKLRNGESVVCTWSGESIKKESDLAIDHAIPFSVLFNNDYWNLVPAKNNVNSKKSDKILSKQQLSNSKSRLISVWNEYQINEEMATTFVAHCQISLTKETEISFENIFLRFSKINQGLIENRGMEEWSA
jgi:CRISPR/Cas system Type II protein with McrA/HNH and RuvC-like nuclease domain